MRIKRLLICYEFLKLKGLLEKYLVSSDVSKRRKQYSSFAKSPLNYEDSDSNINTNWLDEDQQKIPIRKLGYQEKDLKLGSRSSSTAENPILDESHHNLVKKFRMPIANKRAWDIQTYYDVFLQNDGSILLIPKDVNKNHYFIG